MKRFSNLGATVAVLAMSAMSGAALADGTTAPAIDISTASDYINNNGVSNVNKLGVAAVIVAACVGVFRWLKKAA